MNMQTVSSSRMREVGWDNDTMYIRFNDGALYAYYDVSYNEYLNFINSSSLGSELSRLDKVKIYRRL